MKKALLALFCLGITWTVNAQDSTRQLPLIGIEVLRIPANAVLGKGLNGVQSQFVIESTMLLPTKRAKRFIVLRGGYGQYSRATGPATIYTSGKGGFVKGGIENRRSQWVGFGLLGTISVWESRPVYQFQGVFFGDYVGALPTKTNASIGVEGYAAPYFKLSRKLSLNAVLRLNLATGSMGRDFTEPYIVGIGQTAGGTFRIGGGVNLYLLYQL